MSGVAASAQSAQQVIAHCLTANLANARHGVDVPSPDTTCGAFGGDCCGPLRELHLTTPHTVSRLTHAPVPAILVAY